MQARDKLTKKHLAKGYSIETKRAGMVWEARILSETGALAARGYAVETREVFIYDRIVTEPEHRRKGPGHAVMASACR
jgi:GNAT superfamily N-acetyltransferase